MKNMDKRYIDCRDCGDQIEYRPPVGLGPIVRCVDCLRKRRMAYDACDMIEAIWLQVMDADDRDAAEAGAYEERALGYFSQNRLRQVLAVLP